MCVPLLLLLLLLLTTLSQIDYWEKVPKQLTALRYLRHPMRSGVLLFLIVLFCFQGSIQHFFFFFFLFVDGASVLFSAN